METDGENIRWASAPVREEVEAFLAAERELPPEEQIVYHNGGYHIDDLGSRMVRVRDVSQWSRFWPVAVFGKKDLTA